MAHRPRTHLARARYERGAPPYVPERHSGVRLRPVRARLGQMRAQCLSNLAVQDYALLGLCGWLSFKALHDVHGAGANLARVPVLTLFVLGGVTVIPGRAGVLPAGPGRALLYRAGLLATMTGSYFVLRPLLPALHPALLDVRLLAIDRALFAKTPSVWLDRFVSHASVEWFAFFYYCYYGLLAAHVIGALTLDSGRRRYEMLTGAALMMAIGQIGYTFVPGAGPHVCPGLTFPHSLRGGFWWGRVNAAVDGAGANYDIFPSLHTGLSLLIGLHAVRHRRTSVFRWTWLPTVFAVANIVIATVFLRWHYGIDLIAGALLAIAAHRFAVRAFAWEGSAEARTGRQQVWEPIVPLSRAARAASDQRWIVGVVVLQLGALYVLFTYH